MTLDDLWAGFCDPPDEARPRARVALDGRERRSRGHPARPRVAAAGRRPRRADVRRRHGHAARRPARRSRTGRRSGASRRGWRRDGAGSSVWSSPSRPPPAGAPRAGPWVEPADAMKKVVWSETPVDGGGAVEQRLAPLPDVAGPYQDCPRWGADPGAGRCVRDWVALAVPADQRPPPLVPPRASDLTQIDDWAALLDGSFAVSVSLPRDPDGASTGLDRAGLRRAGEVGAVTVGLPGPRGFAAAPPPSRGAGGQRRRRHLPRRGGARRARERRTRRCRCAPSRSRR